MASRSDLAYVQARLQARHGERLTERGWVALNTAVSFGDYVNRAQQTFLRRFMQHLGLARDAHAVEHAIRLGWRDYVAEVAGWLPADWRPAVVWAAHVLDLPVRDGIARAGAGPQWAQADPVLARPLAVLGARPAAPWAVAMANRRGTEARGALAIWLEQWRRLQPRDGARSRVEALADAVLSYLARPPRHLESSEHDRAGLERLLARRFRRDALTPAAVFEHLAMTAIAVERLRGGLVRRAFFEEPVGS